ncbi:hypothetical protein IMZ11_02530 [Microtetraspora sp. AC03309]|uniref:DUF6221 family protein n=1 Tax=Microtetraspora sp. AC03309 TaxID=2779376 RepID=UPI001E5DF7E2|nr:DUF6221 family protein [Microtetraspora sp. AC03309]MCC5574515.1 hypothetical protein [Microtetraspora sp. AC03309]
MSDPRDPRDPRDSLVEFLCARWDERERVAKAAIQGPWRTGEAAEHLIDEVVYGTSPIRSTAIVQVANLEMAWNKRENAAHIVLNDPAYVLADIAAKRRMLDWIERTSAWAADNNLWTCDEAEPLRLLAKPYQEHPDYPKDQP